jgi:hypothetical protein
MPRRNRDGHARAGQVPRGFGATAEGEQACWPVCTGRRWQQSPGRKPPRRAERTSRDGTLAAPGPRSSPSCPRRRPSARAPSTPMPDAAVTGTVITPSSPHAHLRSLAQQPTSKTSMGEPRGTRSRRPPSPVSPGLAGGVLRRRREVGERGRSRRRVELGLRPAGLGKSK